jgi:hypothetical protein
LAVDALRLKEGDVMEVAMQQQSGSLMDGIGVAPKAWSTPGLTCFGRVSEMTASGSRGNPESNLPYGGLCPYFPNLGSCENYRA